MRFLNLGFLTRVVLLAAVLGVCYQSYCQYRDLDHKFKDHWLPFVQGTGAAPEQYRIGVKMTAWWLVQHLSWGFRYGFTLMDVVASTAGALLLYDLLLRSPVIRGASLTLQWFVSAGFVLLVCYYMGWVTFFFRPETLPSFGLTACMAWLWTRRRGGRGEMVLTACGLLAAAAAQAWIRADVAFALNAGIFLASTRRVDHGLSLTRRAALVTSAACVTVAAGTQLYIMRVLYPHASYGKVPVFMVTRDLRAPLSFVPFLLFTLPLMWTAAQAWRKRSVLDTGSRGLLLGSAVYFVLWVLLGKLDEVRIFVPFAVTMIPVTMELIVRRISCTTALAADTARRVEV